MAGWISIHSKAVGGSIWVVRVPTPFKWACLRASQSVERLKNRGAVNHARL